MDSLDNLCGSTHVEDEDDVDGLIRELEDSLTARLGEADSVHVKVELTNASIPNWMRRVDGNADGEKSGEEINFSQ